MYLLEILHIASIQNVQIFINQLYYFFLSYYEFIDKN